MNNEKVIIVAIVDDCPIYVKLVHEALKRISDKLQIKIKAIHINSPLEFRERAKEFDVAVLDLNFSRFPSFLNGAVSSQYVKQKNSDIKILINSSYRREAAKKSFANEINIDDWIDGFYVKASLDESLTLPTLPAEIEEALEEIVLEKHRSFLAKPE